MVIHTDKYEKIVFMENQLKSQKKNWMIDGLQYI